MNPPISDTGEITPSPEKRKGFSSSEADSLPFSLVCQECDAGTEIASREQANAAGWADIIFAPDLPMANWLGVCPSCQKVAAE
jgi:hypothetical protein